MKLTLISLLLILTFYTTYGQKQGNIWYFGDHAGLNFNNNPPTPLLNGQTDFPGTSQFNEGCSSISDSSGSLLFYSNGMKIWNNQQQIMPNGNSLMGHSSSTESCIILPQPNSQRYFYVFTTDAAENNYQNGLRYSIVDMCLNNGKGDILAASKNIFLADTLAEKLICIKHSNGSDYWIVAQKLQTDIFYSFKLTSIGIVDTVISHTGTQRFVGVGQMKASPNGQMIADASPNDWFLGAFHNGFTSLLDFDPATGIVSNERTLSSASTEYGVSFSQDNSKLYFSKMGYGEVYQYNLNAGNLSAIIASKTNIISNGPDSWRQMQLGPDGKIYLSRTSKSYLSIIENPNNSCPACSYVDSAIYLGGQLTSFGLPNFIAGYDYSNTSYNCQVGINQINNSDLAMKVYPNPAQGAFTIELPEKEIFTLLVSDIMGRKIYERKNSNGIVKIDCSSFSDGIYFIQAVNDENILTYKFIKE